MVLRACYEISCTGKAYGNTRLVSDARYWHRVCMVTRDCYAMSGTDLAHVRYQCVATAYGAQVSYAIRLRVCYAMSVVADLAYGTICTCDVQYCPRGCCCYPTRLPRNVQC
eukprot:3940877-Rhodomonas_salina.1